MNYLRQICLLDFSNKKRHSQITETKVSKQAHRCFYQNFPFEKTVYNFVIWKRTSRMQLFTISCIHTYIRLTIGIVCNHSQLPNILDMDKRHYRIRDPSASPVRAQCRPNDCCRPARRGTFSTRKSGTAALAVETIFPTHSTRILIPILRRTRSLIEKRLDELQGCMFATTLVATEFSLVQVRSPLETHADRKRKKKNNKRVVVLRYARRLAW